MLIEIQFYMNIVSWGTVEAATGNYSAKQAHLKFWEIPWKIPVKDFFFSRVEWCNWDFTTKKFPPQKFFLFYIFVKGTLMQIWKSAIIFVFIKSALVDL